MDKEKLLKNIEELMQRRRVLNEKLSQIDKLSFKEKEFVYESFRENFKSLIQVEKMLNDLEFDEWYSFIKDCNEWSIQNNSKFDM